ncbi:MAG: VWA domain-containing protein [Candidatus Brocadiia bacterium]
MDITPRPRRLVLLVALVLAVGSAGLAAEAEPLAGAANLVVPQRGVQAVERSRRLEVAGVSAEVSIEEVTATTTLTIGLYNPHDEPLDAELLVPLPDGSETREVALVDGRQGLDARPVSEERSLALCHGLARAARWPALLEFAGLPLARTSPFSVPPREIQRVQLTYRTPLSGDGRRIDYVLPRSESLDYRVPWEVTVEVASKRPIAALYSPTHEIERKGGGEKRAVARLAEGDARKPGPLRLSCLFAEGGAGASLFAYPGTGGEDGYFLLLAGLPSAGGHGPAIPREVTMVIDRSGSMKGRKLREARRAAEEVINSLSPGEAYNVIVYNERVEALASRPVLKEDAGHGPLAHVAAVLFLERVRARGGTNMYAALRAALSQKPRKGVLPIVLFLTDGLPTVGETSEVAIRDLVVEGNPYGRRVFTFGLGAEVNSPLLDYIAARSRGLSTYVLPDEKVDRKVVAVFQRLASPVLAEAALRAIGPDGQPAPQRLRHVIPSQAPDLFQGDPLVVLGRYTGREPLRLELEGHSGGEKRAFRFRFDLDRASTANYFVPRLWASRRIGVLSDQVRQLGAATAAPALQQAPEPRNEVRELVDEITRRSTRHGILTEYTAFLARQDTDLGRRRRVLAQVVANYEHRAMATRFGQGALNQSLNTARLRDQRVLNPANTYYDEEMNEVAVRAVQQMGDRAFYRRGRRWVDSRLLGGEALPPATTVAFGSPQHLDLLRKLARQGRQGCISLEGDILLRVDGRPVLVEGPPAN